MSPAGSTASGGKVVELHDVYAGYYAAGSFASIRSRFEQVLRGVSLKVSRGERVAIVGESGSGKTTLLRVILGLLPPVKGEVLVLGHKLYAIPWQDRWRVTRRIGYVPQDPFRSLNSRLRVAEILTEPLLRTNLTKREELERAKEALGLVQLHESVLEYYPSQLSGGMMQRVLIARAIVCDPELLVLDEPTSSLDVSTQAQVINLLNLIQECLGCAMITVTHDLPVAQYLAECAVIMHGGSIVEEGPFEEIVKAPRSEYARALVRSYYLGASPLQSPASRLESHGGSSSIDPLHLQYSTAYRHSVTTQSAASLLEP